MPGVAGEGSQVMPLRIIIGLILARLLFGPEVEK